MVDGCSCLASDQRAQYCDSAYVVIAKVINVSYRKGVPQFFANRIYDVDVMHVYKGNVNKGPVRVRTAARGTMCGVSLRKNAMYLLNGGIYTGQMWINSCDMMAFYPVNDPKKYVPFDYDCRCKVKNMILEGREKKSKWICARGNTIRCPPESGKMAECRYDRDKDDCVWTC
ncbi:uncharacterized protein LOC125677225 isoform X2 [Ostrea edulis]|nr:uncharacterized protein LOC125677225 isoform X2 [Ostrea edulis]